MVSIREFARNSGVTYEAIRKKIKRYSEELEGHIHVQGRTQYLDDAAVEFLSEHKAGTPLAIYDGVSADDVQDLRDTVSELQEQLIEAQRLALASQGALLEAQAARLALAAAEAERNKLSKDVDNARREASEARQEAAEARMREETALSKAEDLRRALEASEARERVLKERSWWQRLMRKGE